MGALLLPVSGSVNGVADVGTTVGSVEFGVLVGLDEPGVLVGDVVGPEVGVDVGDVVGDVVGVVVVTWSQTQSSSRVLSSRTWPEVTPTPTTRTFTVPVFGSSSRVDRLVPGWTLLATGLTGTTVAEAGLVPTEKFTASSMLRPTPKRTMKPRWGWQTNSV